MICRHNLIFSWCLLIGSLLFAAALTVLTPVHAQAFAGQGAILRSASETDYPPYCIVDEGGAADGFSVELLRAAIQVMGHEVDFRVGPWSDVKAALENRKVDVLPLVGRTPEREAVFDFTAPYLSMHGTVVVRSSDDAIQGLADLKGRRVAVMRGDNAEEFLRRSHPEITLAPRATFAEALQELSAGQHDAVVIQKLLAMQLMEQQGFSNLKSVGPPLEEFTQEFSFAVAEGDRRTLDLLNEGLAIVMADGTFESLYRKWITPVEKSKLGLDRILVGGDSNYPPYEYLDENGQPAGFNVELTREIARQMGLEVEIRLAPWNEIRSGLDLGTIDLTHGMFYSVERDTQYHFSPAHSRVSHVAVTRQGEPLPASLEDLAQRSVVVMSGDIMHDLVREYPVGRLVDVASQEEALRLVAEGRYDCALVARLPALYWIKQRGWDDLKVGESPWTSPEYCYAVKHGNEPLLATFSEGLAILEANGRYRDIYQSTLAVYEEQNLDLSTLIFGVLGSSALVGMAFLGWVRLLRKQVKARTAALEQEVVERRHAEDALVESEARFYTMFHDHDAIMLLIDPYSGDIVDANRAASRYYGYGIRVLKAMNVAEINTSSRNELAASRKRVLQETQKCFEYQHRLASGELRDVEIHASPIRIGDEVLLFAIIHDISERKRLEIEFRQQSRLASLGELSAGIAHEINNPVGLLLWQLPIYAGVMQEALKLLRERSDAATLRLGEIGLDEIDQYMEETLREVQSGAERVRGIVDELKGFVAPDQAQEATRVDLNAVVTSALDAVAKARQKPAPEIDLQLSPEPLYVWGDVRRFEQVFVNVLENACEALGEVHPKITIVSRVGADTGQHLVEICDNGCGIAPEHLEHVTDPFFTTRRAEGGTGLGLSLSSRTVRQYQGRLEIESQLNSGTKVRVVFPGEVSQRRAG